MNKQEKLKEYLRSLPPQVINVVTKVIKAEREKLHLRSPKGINNEIRQIIQQESDQRET